MTENEIIEILDDIWTFWHEPTDEERLAANKAIDLIQELQQYRTIGTIEECREARERQRAKKPIMKPFYEDMEEEYLCCPTCGDILTDRIPMDNKDFYFHCLNCGQKLDWYA